MPNLAIKNMLSCCRMYLRGQCILDQSKQTRLRACLSFRINVSVRETFMVRFTVHSAPNAPRAPAAPGTSPITSSVKPDPVQRKRERRTCIWLRSI